MAGIYIHIPFCRQKCSYCDFHFSTDSSYAARMIQALSRELQQRSVELNSEQINTIYFGGGTPSVLTKGQLDELLRTINQGYSLANDVEITLEANPDDISVKEVMGLLELGVNRLSMGIQSFDDQVLKSMNRSHDSRQAREAVRAAQDVGLGNISVDLIYGLPGKDLRDLEIELDEFINLEVPHLSAYALTIEKGTLFHHQVRAGELRMPEEKVVEAQFFHLRERLSSQGYEQYEVSNFARTGHISRHNSSYWMGEHYIGIGPSAHSFDGVGRSWNISNNHHYMQSIEEGIVCNEAEALSQSERYNEYVLTRLRTKWGLELDYLKKEFEVDIFKDYRDVWRRYEGRYSISDGHLILDPKGLVLADGLASDLFQIT